MFAGCNACVLRVFSREPGQFDIKWKNIKLDFGKPFVSHLGETTACQEDNGSTELLMTNKSMASRPDVC